ncbi:tRNA uridine-5-carboxymethylaminomethyl(34) synthesis GTPase MnmE [Spirochaeta isovalerica]|uniref:tRNA modification GTPase MnmE n=1 Tax=Spirochaeta isovalerica TaxID=150 RepID=A0A841RB52_9SPIO|nr:tRNA uridine-5-carboxymethylaminomethyl(34) synthesis GTPase MnmE [Spirochaeta isovalerica]MBB6482624.1 tRNA modification GTPase [Spirochaeta isovalerica]
MKDFKYDPDDLIAALATPWAESALAVIRTTGPDCISAAARIFSPSDKLDQAAGNSIVYGYISDGEVKLDEVTAAVYRAPRSYTGQESVEFFVHGSLPGIRKILELLFRSGFREASPGEFTFRAFLNQKMDLTRAEAVQEIISAKSNQAQSLALNRLSGSIENSINTIKSEVTDLLASVEIQLDYPEDEAEMPDVEAGETKPIVGKIDRLLSTYRAGKIYQEGVRVVLAGKTNAGKSSLFNLFLKEDRSIVSDIHGTTRDYLESWISIGGIPVRLFDTAGLREADHPIEAEGIRRSNEIIDNAHVILYVADAQEGITADLEAFMSAYKEDSRCLYVWNKIDKAATAAPDGFIKVSALTAEGFAELEEAIKTVVFRDHYVPGNEPVIDSMRQKKLLEEAREALNRYSQALLDGMPMDMAAVELTDALNALGEITGEVTSADVLERMFSNFCVGK